MSLLAVALSLGLASPAQRAPVEPAIARVIEAALLDREAPATDWSAVAERLGPHVNLYERGPTNEDRRNLDEGAYRHSGWISESGASGGLAICGDAREVHAVSVSMSRIWLRRSDLLTELAALGVTAVEIDRQAPVTPEETDDYSRSLSARRTERVTWTLEKPGRADAVLLADDVCTPPGMRSARQCWMRFTIRLRPAGPTPMECELPGRWGV